MTHAWRIMVAAGLLVTSVAHAADAVDRLITQRWERHDAAGVFSVLLPDTMAQLPDRSEDSFIEAFADDVQRLWFDYGMYSGDLTQYAHEAEFTERAAVIDGASATIVTFVQQHPRWPGMPYCAAVHVPDAGPGMFDGDSTPSALTMLMCGTEPRVRLTAEAVFESIDFPERIGGVEQADHGGEHDEAQ
jgi:hypothetical protein